MKTLKHVLLFCFVNVLLMSSCTHIPDIVEKDIPFKKHMKTLKFASTTSRNGQFEDFSYRPYFRFVQPSCDSAMMLKVLFLKKDYHNISKVSFNRIDDGKHYQLAIFLEDIPGATSGNEESAVELKFSMEKFKDMQSFFDRKKTAYFEVGIANASKNNEPLGYMIVSNDINGGTLDPPPLHGGDSNDCGN